MIKIQRIKCKFGLNEIRNKILVHPYNNKHHVNSDNLKVVLADVSERERLHKKYHANLGEYKEDSYRAFFQGNLIVIYIHEFDTCDSLKWMFVHEATHYELSRSSLLYNSFYKERLKFVKQTERKYKQKWSESLYLKDAVHDNVPEEVFCDRVATNFVGKKYGRKWWRKQLKAQKNG